MKNKIIISLTSHPARINTVHESIKSLLNQTYKADKIILWLADSQFPTKENELPQQLLQLKSDKFIIDWCEDIKSYKKLIPTLKKYPNDIIVTADDDLIYESNWLELLIKEYKKNRNKKLLICHRITRLYWDDNKNFKVLDRKLYNINTPPQGIYYDILRKPNVFNKLSGGAGCLYPPNCFKKEIFDKNVFLNIAPTSDDIWFYIQALRNNYKVKVCSNNLSNLKYIPNTQDVGLCRINDSNNKQIFYQHLNAIYNLYPELKLIFNKDNKRNNKVIKTLNRLNQQNNKRIVGLPLSFGIYLYKQIKVFIKHIIFIRKGI